MAMWRTAAQAPGPGSAAAAALPRGPGANPHTLQAGRPRVLAACLLEAVLEHHHEEAQDELAGGVAKAPQRAQQGGLELAAPDGQRRERRQVVRASQRVQAARRQARPRAAHRGAQACGGERGTAW